MRRLSGDHVTSLSADFVKVICRGSAPPSAGTSQRSLDESFSSYAALVMLKTTHLPSGLGVALPTRGMRKSVSCVSARLAGILMMRGLSCAAAATAIIRRKIRERRLTMARHSIRRAAVPAAGQAASRRLCAGAGAGRLRAGRRDAGATFAVALADERNG